MPRFALLAVPWVLFLPAAVAGVAQADRAVCTSDGETSLLHLHADVLPGQHRAEPAAAAAPSAASSGKAPAQAAAPVAQGMGFGKTDSLAALSQMRQSRRASTAVGLPVTILLLAAVFLVLAFGAWCYFASGRDEGSKGDAANKAKLATAAPAAAGGPEPVAPFRAQGGTSLSIEWRELSFSMGEKQILKGVTGILQPGRLTAVLGPSGSGKTTLMNLLTGRVNTTGPGGRAPLAGEVSTSGKVTQLADMRKKVAYVMQGDHLFPFQTPRECIAFSAALSREQAKEERAELVESVLLRLGLGQCADTLVGNESFQGISGGQRKRTAIGVELVVGPGTIFLDEPLSGLDSYAAFMLVESLKDLSSTGASIMVSIHQPSSEIFAMFDDVIVLHGGETVFHGAADALASHFDRWEKCPSNFNPADHVMFLLQKEAEASSGRVSEMKEAWRASEARRALDLNIERLKASDERNSAELAVRKLGFFQQLRVLLAREAVMIVRNKKYLGARWGANAFLATMYSCVFFGIGRGTSCSAEPLDTVSCTSLFSGQYNAIVGLDVTVAFGTINAFVMSFPMERPAFLREYASQKYDVIPYIIAKTMVEMLVLLVGQCLSWSIAYFMMGLTGNLIVFVIIAWLLGMSAGSIALTLGSCTADPSSASAFVPIILVPQLALSGLLIPATTIPAWLRWLEWACPLRYGVSLAVLNEFQFVRESIASCEARDTVEHCSQKLPGMYLQESLLQNEGVIWADAEWMPAVLVASFLIFVSSGALFLWRRGQFVY